jgi:hypothetical protein
MANTYTLIASSTAGSGGVANIDFTSIPAIYTDLNIFLSARTNNTTIYGAIKLQFNNSTTTYSGREIYGSGSAVAGYSRGVTDNGLYIGDVNGNTTTANLFSNFSIYIPNYTSSDYKSVSVDGVQENNATEAYSRFLAGLWSTGNAITSIKFSFTGATILEHSTAYLYGIKSS